VDVRDENGHLIRELHGVTLAQILDYLVARVGWVEMEQRVRINCFAVDPTVRSSLSFLRKTAWARKKVEEFYVELRIDDVLTRKPPAP
jgi:uncharacterized protein (DUF2132 family)